MDESQQGSKSDFKFKVIDIGISIPQKPLVLVVDDELAVQTVVYDTLSDDYRLVAASNGREGVMRAGHLRPHVILMDVMMPDIGGYEAVRLLSQDPNTKEIPVVMVTAQDFDKSTVQLIKNEPNVVAFITKPFRPKNLRDTVKYAIGKRNSA